jgi:hypothetical protein
LRKNVRKSTMKTTIKFLKRKINNHGYYLLRVNK